MNMEQGVKFRPMGRGDVPAVAEIERICFRSPWTERMFMSELKNRLACYHVVEHAGKLIAYAGMWTFLDEAHITNVAVLPEYRRQGLGTKVMLWSMEAAHRRKATKMTLEVRVSNLGAQAMYANVGFAVAGRRKRYYSDTGEDALVLWNEDIQKTLAEHGFDI